MPNGGSSSLEPLSGATPEAYRTLLERVPAIVYIAEEHADGRWHYVSPWINPILGFTVEEWLADNTLWSRQLHPEDRERTIQLERDTENAFDAEPKAVATEYRMLHRDGHVVWIRDESVLIPDQHGQPRWYGVLSDITAAKNVELEIEHQAAATAAVARIGGRALKRISVPQLLDEACRAAAEVLQVDVALVAQLRADQGLELTALHGWDKSELGVTQIDQTAGSQAHQVLLTGEPMQVVDWDRETRFTRPQTLAKHGVRSNLYLRIEGNGQPFGIFGVLCTEPRTYSESDIHFARAIVNVISDAVERQQAEDAIEHRALHDSLTGLPNRVLFLDRVEQSFERLRRHRTLAAVLFIDVDHFKQINDTLGHHAGDALLVSVATRIRETIRPTDTVARFGGDEFGLLLDDISSERDAIATAERIAASFARPLLLEAGSHFVTLSIGIALTDGHEQPAELIRNADNAMYRAKERGRARYELFDENMRVRAIARLRLESDLRRALDQRELSLRYQPMVKLSDETICGAEVLLRWDHPSRGSVPPAEFIPLAEESGLIDRIGQWVFEEACRDAAEWAEVKPDVQPIRVHVNVSAAQLANARFPEAIAEAVRACALSADQLSVEISESVLLEDTASGRRALRRLQAKGMGIVIDDFGTGHSSLSHLSSMPVSAVKLDRRFVADLTTEGADTRAVKAVIAMANALELSVIATGTETREQVRELLELGCECAQGYLFSPPVTSAEFTAML